MTWVRPDEAIAAFAEAGQRPTHAALRVIAHREDWRRIKAGRDVAYHLDDVTDTVLRRKAKRRLEAA